MENPVSPKTKVLSDEVVGTEPFTIERRWILLRWILLGVVVLTTFIGNRLIHLSIPAGKVFFLSAITGLLNLLFYFSYSIRKKDDAVRDLRLYSGVAHLQYIVDWLFIASIFHYSGGIASPMLFYFLFHIILSVIQLENRKCWFYVSLISFTIIAIAILELFAYLPHMYRASFISQSVQSNPFFVLLLLVLFNTVLYASVFVVRLLLKQINERLSMFMEFQSKLEQANQQHQLLNQLAKDTTSTLGLYPRLSVICRSVVKIMALKGATIRLLNEKTNLLELASSCGLSEAYINKGPVDADKSLAKALEGKPHYVWDAATDPSVQYPEEARKEGIISMLAFPFRGREKIIGTLRLYTGENRTFSQNELDFIGALCSQAAISIENAKIYDTQKKQDKAKNEFIMMMTHELKGPLMAIRGLLEVILKGYVGTLSDKQKELVDRVDSRIKSVVEVSTGLLDIFEWRSRKPDMQWIPLSLKDQIQNAAHLFADAIGEKGLSIDVALPEKDVIVMASENDMEKILNNLITNAIKYTPTGGNIHLELSSFENRAVLQIKNTGIIIAPEDMPKIFEEHYRTQEAKAIDPYGKGLGLPFVKQVVEALGGDIRVESEKDKGTVFIVSLPEGRMKGNL